VDELEVFRIFTQKHPIYVLVPSEIVAVVGDNCNSASVITRMSQVFVQVICPKMGVNRSREWLPLASRASHALARGLDRPEQIHLTTEGVHRSYSWFIPRWLVVVERMLDAGMRKRTLQRNG
jgi:hypothetical protein